MCDRRVLDLLKVKVTFCTKSILFPISNHVVARHCFALLALCSFFVVCIAHIVRTTIIIIWHWRCKTSHLPCLMYPFDTRVSCVVTQLKTRTQLVSSLAPHSNFASERLGISEASMIRLTWDTQPGCLAIAMHIPCFHTADMLTLALNYR